MDRRSFLQFMGGLASAATVSKGSGEEADHHASSPPAAHKHRAGICTIGNHAGARQISVNGRLHTVAFENRLQGVNLPVKGEEFRIGWVDGGETVASEFRVERVLNQTTSSVEVELRQPKSELRARVAYWADESLPVLRKRVSLEGDSRGRIVHWLEVESLTFPTENVTYSAYAESPEELRKIPATPAPYKMEELGQPVFLESVFLGLEFPAGYNWEHPDCSIRLKHYPGQAVAPSKPLESQIAIIGFSPDKQLLNTLEDYIFNVKVHPSMLRFLSVYSCFAQIYPPRLPGGVAAIDRIKHLFSVEEKQETFDAFTYDAAYKMYRTDGIFVPQEPGLWDKTEPLLNQAGMKLGMWTSFSNIFDTSNHDWGRKQGYELQHSRAFCIAGPKFRAAYLKRYEDILQRHDVSFISYDGMFAGQGYYCNTPGHGHYATPVPDAADFANRCASGEEYAKYMHEHGGPEAGRAGLEATTNAEIEIWGRMRQWRPQIFLDLFASSNCLSPWFLRHLDTVHIGEDAGVTSMVTPHGRESLIQARDVEDEGFFHGEKTKKFPLWGIDNYGCMVRSHYISYQLKEENEPITSGWQSEAIMTTVARGSQINQTIDDLELMSQQPEFAQFFDQLISWMKDNREIYQHTRMFGGRPSHYEPFGYIQYGSGSDRILAAVRNPSLNTQNLKISLVPELGFHDPAIEYHAWTVYPYQHLDSRRWRSGEEMELQLGPFEVRVIEFRIPALLPGVPLPLDVRFGLDQVEDKLKYRLFLEPGSVKNVAWSRNLNVGEWSVSRPWQRLRVQGGRTEISGGDHSVPEMSVSAPVEANGEADHWKFRCSNPGGYRDAQILLLQRGTLPPEERIEIILSGIPWAITDVLTREYVGYGGVSPFAKGLADRWYRKMLPSGRFDVDIKLKQSGHSKWGIWLYGARRLSPVELAWTPARQLAPLPVLLPSFEPDFKRECLASRELQ